MVIETGFWKPRPVLSWRAHIHVRGHGLKFLNIVPGMYDLALSEAGSLLLTVVLEGIPMQDWEDIAIYNDSGGYIFDLL